MRMTFCTKKRLSVGPNTKIETTETICAMKTDDSVVLHQLLIFNRRN